MSTLYTPIAIITKLLMMKQYYDSYAHISQDNEVTNAQNVCK